MFKKILFISIMLVFCSNIISMIVINIVPVDFSNEVEDIGEIITIDPSVTIDEYIKNNEEIWEQKIKELKAQDRDTQFAQALIKERKVGLFISWVPWFFLPFFLRLKKVQILLVVPVLFISYLLGFTFWFELPVFLFALLIGREIKKRYSVKNN